MLNCNSLCSHYHFSTRKSEVASPFHRSHARKREVPRKPRNDGSNDKRYAEGSAASSLYAVHAPRGNHLKQTVWWCTKRKGATQQYRIRWEWYASEENAIPGKTKDQRGWFDISWAGNGVKEWNCRTQLSFFGWTSINFLFLAFPLQIRQKSSDKFIIVWYNLFVLWRVNYAFKYKTDRRTCS